MQLCQIQRKIKITILVSKIKCPEAYYQPVFFLDTSTHYPFLSDSTPPSIFEVVGPSRQNDQFDKETVISLATPGLTPIIREQYGIPVQITPRIGQFLGRRTRSLDALRPIPRSYDTLSQNINTNIEAGLKLLLSNTMSLAPKIDEIRCCILERLM